MYYYAGVSPTPPKLVYRTSSTTRPFVKPTGFEAYRHLKQARGVHGHALNAVWKTSVGPKVCQVLTTLKVAWTTVDGVRFLTDTGNGKTTMGPVVIWIGVRPGSLKAKDAHNAALDILSILRDFDIHDVEVEVRESLYRRSAGPPLLKSVSNYNHTVDVRGPLTTALGLRIAAADRPDAQGTMAVFFAEGGESTKLLGLTCHHVVLKADASHNEDYTLRGVGARRKYIQLLGTRAFNALEDAIRFRIGRHGTMVDILRDDIARLMMKTQGDDEAEVSEAVEALADVERQLARAETAIDRLEDLYDTVKTDWGQPTDRFIGHIRRSPPIKFNVQPGGFTEDWAAIELDESKFVNFSGNFIDLGTEMPSDVFTLKMYPRPDGRPNFKYPPERLLPLRDMITEELMRAPDMLDNDNEACLLVIKNGNTTGVTIGRATGIESFIHDEETGQASMEWAVYNYGGNLRVFSAPGDSGSMVADGRGRMGGILTGNAGKTEYSDVSYFAPMCWLWPRIKAVFPHADLYPTTMALS